MTRQFVDIASPDRRKVIWSGFARRQSKLLWRQCEGTQDLGGTRHRRHARSERLWRRRRAGTGEQGGTTESIAPISSQDINIKDRGELAQGGTIRLSVADFGNNWNPYNVDGNNADLSNARRALICRSSSTTTPRACPTPNPNWLVSAEETNANPTTVNSS